jgi:hypothetical protein
MFFDILPTLTMFCMEKSVVEKPVTALENNINRFAPSNFFIFWYPYTMSHKLHWDPRFIHVFGTDFTGKINLRPPPDINENYCYVSILRELNPDPDQDLGFDDQKCKTFYCRIFCL